MNLALARVKRFLQRNPNVKHLILWGNGQLGSAIIKLVQTHFQDIESLSIVDSTINQSRNEGAYQLHPVDALKHLPCDCLIIASIAYEPEILKEIKLQYASLKDRVFSLSCGTTLNDNSEAASSNDNPSALGSRIFEYPDDPLLWRALANNASEKDKAFYLQCAAILQTKES